MAAPPDKSFSLTRRLLLQQLAGSPLLLSASKLHGMGLLESLSAGAVPPFTAARYLPTYPERSPLEDVLRLVPPGLDEFGTEKTAAELEQILSIWADALKAGAFTTIEQSCAPDLVWSRLTPSHQRQQRSSYGLHCVAYTFKAASEQSARAFVSELAGWLGAHQRLEHGQFEMTAITQPKHVLPGTLREIDTEVRFSLVLQGDSAHREQRVGTWRMGWLGGETGWRIARLQALTESRATLQGPGFVDVTAQALGGASSYTQQMLRGADYWRTVLDGACGMDVYGNNGVCVGDFDNDGLDDLYVSQPAGLPNRLYRNRGDGTFEDVTEHAGVGVLDDTACALFADLRNSGLQDLLVVTGGGPLLFVNQGDGTFTLKRDAFQFARPPE